MRLFLIPALMALVMTSSSRANTTTEERLKKLEDDYKSYKENQKTIAEQVLMSQTTQEERIRTDGSSGLKQNRITTVGTRPCLTNTHTGSSYSAIHNHADHMYTAGMGEVTAVMNGVEFRTRHNDFPIRQRRKHDDPNSKTEIELPDVPQSVTNKTTFEEQVAEMREYFVAWKTSNTSHRNYVPYFQPVLCIMEGSWLNKTDDKIIEAFPSDRHHFDAKTWHELLARFRFSGYTGRKDAKENFSFLPTRLMGIDKNGKPVIAQWQYNIICHKVTGYHIPLSAFKVIDDLSARVCINRKTSLEKFAYTRSARFALNPELHKYATPGKDVTKAPFRERRFNEETFMDKLMGQFPGKDGYGADLKDKQYGIYAFPLDKETSNSTNALNVANYNRIFKEPQIGAMGTTRRKRGYSDPDLYMARTTNAYVASMTAKLMDESEPISQRWSSAFPLEIIYLTPLNKWNPRNVEYKGKHNRRDPYPTSVYAGGRNGGFTTAKAYNGTNSKFYYHTPVELFKGSSEVDEQSAADTAKGAKGVVDPSGVVRTLMPSGIRVFFPDMEGVGITRQRWPVSPVHGEGSGVWKELDAVKLMVLNWKTNNPYFHENLADLSSCPLKKNRR